MESKVNRIIINGIVPESIAEELGLNNSDELLSVNGNKIFDILDYKFEISDEYVELEIKHKDGEVEIYEIEKDENEDIGIIFEDELIDSPKRCQNKCIFCFMEQLPEKVRDTLIFKDDDYRLSFFTGNYITMTNMKESDVDRIIKYRLSPINISVHATDVAVRCEMLNNKNAGIVLKYMEKLAKAGISMNAQIVLCPGYNDGDILEKTILDLTKYMPYIKSICIVPVGITKHRDNLTKLKTVDSTIASEVVNTTEKYQKIFKEKYGTNLVYIADEFYSLAEVKVPEYIEYEDFSQLENGVGMLAVFKYEFEKHIKEIQRDKRYIMFKEGKEEKKITVLTGKISYKHILEYAKVLEEKFKGIHINLVWVPNEFFGERITVTGLVTGSDILKHITKLKEQKADFGEYILIPNVMLKNDEKIFLDDMSLDDLEEQIGIKIKVTDNTAKGFINGILEKV